MVQELLKEDFHWGYAFLFSKGYLEEQNRLEILCQAIEMLYDGVEKKGVRSEEYEGTIYSARKYEVLGGFAGHRYNATIETNDGRVEMSFLICDQTGREEGVHNN